MKNTNENGSRFATASKAGYLMEDFRMFYLKGKPDRQITPHYHDFHKLLLLISGNIFYSIEGIRYQLFPSDMIFVEAGKIHVPLIEAGSAYERLIIYISPELSDPHLDIPESLFHCFTGENGYPSPLVHPSAQMLSPLHDLTQRCIHSFDLQDSYRRLYQYTLLLEMLISLNRTVHMIKEPAQGSSTRIDPAVQRCIQYISDHLVDDDLCVDSIAAHAMISRSYLMHSFKRQMGCSIGEYISEKKLFLAGQLLARGVSVTEACYQSGFRNYSAFYYAYRRKYGVSPSAGHLPGQSLREE